MWNLSLFILYITSLFALVSAGTESPDFYFPLNTCTLTVQSTIGKVADPRTLITYGVPVPPSISNRNEYLTLDFTGIFNRFAISDPPANPLRVRF